MGIIMIDEIQKSNILDFFQNQTNSKRIRTTLNDKNIYNIYETIFKMFINKNVLDIGCNMGHFSVLISNFANKVYGIDISENNIKIANELKRKLDTDNKLQFELISAFDINIDFINNKQVNAIFLYKVSGYWPYDNEIKFWQLCIDSNIEIIIINVYNEKKYIKELLFKNGYKFEYKFSKFLIITKI